MFDSVAFSRKSGVRAPRRPVPVALGLPSDGKNEIVDYSLTRSAPAHGHCTKLLWTLFAIHEDKQLSGAWNFLLG